MTTRPPDAREELAEAEALVERLKLRIAQGSCAETGHDWRHIGGCNAGCCDECGCSVPVHECAKCKDCDYGDNDEATRVKSLCNEGLQP